MLTGMSSTTAASRAAWRARARRWSAAWSDRPALGDALLVVGLLLLLLATSTTPAVVDPEGELAEPLLTLDGGWRGAGWAWALQLALVVPLLWRRRAPTLVFLVIAAVAFVQWLAGPELYGDVAVLIALYTVAAHEPRPRAVVAVAAIAALGLALAAARWGAGNGSTTATLVSMATMTALPLALGLLVRSRRRSLLASRDAAARAERTRISREMHDVVAHNLSVMVALADGARMTVDRDPAEAKAAIGQVARTGRDALSEMRRLLGVIEDPTEAAPLRPQPTLDQLPELAATVRATGLDVRLDLDPALTVPAGLGLTVHRIVQEALTNVLKHAPAATRAVVSVHRSGFELRVEVHDDGPSTADAPGHDRSGHGLRGMAERAALHGGRVDAGPDPDGGWRVRATLPWKDGAA